jgi:membrane-associated phospholipid phosphatase
MVAIGALSGGLLGVSMVFNINLLFPIFMVILFSGLLGYSRLSLGKHRPLEVYGGYLTGLAIMLVHYFLF